MTSLWNGFLLAVFGPLYFLAMFKRVLIPARQKAHIGDAG